MVTAQQIIDGADLTGSVATYYTQPGNTAQANSNRTVIQQLVLTNNDTAPVDVSLYIVPFGSSATNTFRVGGAPMTLAVGESRIIYEVLKMVLRSGGTIQAIASTAGVVSIMASGTEMT